jgi:hypothetical protein
MRPPSLGPIGYPDGGTQALALPPSTNVTFDEQLDALSAERL